MDASIPDTRPSGPRHLFTFEGPPARLRLGRHPLRAEPRHPPGQRIRAEVPQALHRALVRGDRVGIEDGGQVGLAINPGHVAKACLR